MTDDANEPLTEDLPPLQRWISVELVKFDVPDLKRLTKAAGFDLIVEADALGLAVYDLDRQPVLWVDAITAAEPTREDFEEEMDEFRARIDRGGPQIIVRVLDRARTIVALSAFSQVSPQAAEALATAVGEQVKRCGDAVRHVVGEGFFGPDGALLVSES